MVRNIKCKLITGLTKFIKKCISICIFVISSLTRSFLITIIISSFCNILAGNLIPDDDTNEVDESNDDESSQGNEEGTSEELEKPTENDTGESYSAVTKYLHKLTLLLFVLSI